MSNAFDVDVQQIQQVAKDWNTETEAMEKLPGQLSAIEGHLSSLLEHTFLQDLFNPAAEIVQTGIWFALRDALNKASGELGKLVQQLQQDAQLLNRCSIEYQIADDAAANNITNIQSALSSNAPGSSQIRSLLNQLSGGNQSTAQQAAQGLLGTATSGDGSTTTAGTGTGTGTGTGGSGTGGGASAGTGTGGGGGGGTGTGGGSSGGVGRGGSGGGGGTVTSGVGTGGGSGGGGTGSSGSGSGGSGGGSGTGKAGVTDTSGGDWKTTGSWDAWVRSGDHDGPRTGQGMQTKLPDYSKLPTARQQIMKNMVARIDHKIGYSQSAATDGYRDDCSGSVSAAWGLAKPGTDCRGLMSSSVAHRIGKDELEPGDALVAQDHVVLFGGWADKEHTEYYALEDNGSQGSVAHVIPYPYYSEHGVTPGGTYEPYRKNGVS